MDTFTLLFFVTLLVFPSFALPQGPLIVRPNDPNKILCQLSILKQFLCPCSGSSATNRPTPLGTAHATVDSSGAYRFPVKYASAPRWGPSTLVTAWDLPFVRFYYAVHLNLNHIITEMVLPTFPLYLLHARSQELTHPHTRKIVFP